MDATLERRPTQTAAERHFGLHLQQAVLALVGQAAARGESVSDFAQAHPFLADSLTRMAEQGLEGVSLDEAGSIWRRLVARWESDPALPHLPLRALRSGLGLEPEAVELLMLVGLVDEDARFGAVFAHLAGAPVLPRPTLAMLAEACGGDADLALWRRRLLGLHAAGLVEIVDPDAPASTWVARVPLVVWDALRGHPPQGGGAGFEFVAAAELPPLQTLVLAAPLRTRLQRLLPALAAGEVEVLALRGARANGRRTVLKAVARELGLNALVMRADGAAPAAGLMAALLNAMPLVAADAAPGEAVELPPLAGWPGAVGVALGHEGALAGPRWTRAVVVPMPLPGPAERQALWDVGDADAPPDLRMSSGHIRRAAALAGTQALLDGQAAPTPEHRRRAAAALGQETLDGLATRVAPLADGAEVVLGGDTADEFAALVARCRHREQLGDEVGASLAAQLGCGVRALFRGPSGCGKTLAARRLAALLERELYRVDLAAIVDKYIGESEKRLARVLDRAEEVDAVLLFDEGDSLLGKRTAVQTSTDRYANLETNFLLQRLDEGFGGIVVVTTNSADQIDNAFRRRMDAVIDFRLPDALERQALWRLHLPAQHAVDEDFIDELAFRCPFAGGQIRNAVLHAALVALQRGSRLRTEHLEAAVRREYRKSGGVCPLRGATARA